MKMRWLYSLLTIGVLSAIVLSWATQDSGTRDYEFFTVIAAQTEQLPDVTMPGTVIGVEQTAVYARASGIASKVLVHVGQKVKEGDLLVALDGSEEEVKMYRNLLAVRKEMRANQKLRGALTELRGIRGAEPVEAARRGILETEVLRVLKDYLTYDSLLEEYKRRSVDKFILAPSDGLVVELNARVGDRVDALRPVRPVATIAPPMSSESAITVRLEIPEEVITRVRAGQDVALHVPFSASEPLAAKMQSVSLSPFIEENNRYFPGTAIIDAQAKREELRYGMRIMADVRIAEVSGGIWIPTAALDLKLPNHLVQSAVNTQGNPTVRSQLAGKGASETTAEKPLGPVSRALATELAPKATDLREIYLLTSNRNIVRTQVAVLAANERQTLVNAPQLEGAQIITHFRPKTRSVLALLGN